jgi:alpha-1,4-galacturonosyltransferase
MRVAAGGGRESSSSSSPSAAAAAGVALRALLIATACGLVFALLNLPDGRAASLSPGECRSPHSPGPVTA